MCPPGQGRGHYAGRAQTDIDLAALVPAVVATLDRLPELGFTVPSA